MSEKPEWFEMTEGEQKPAEVAAKSNKRLLKLALFTAPLVLVGGAMVFADGNGPDDAPNINTTIPSSTSSAIAANTAISTSTKTVASKSITAKQSSDRSSTSIAPSSPNANPSKGTGIQAPSGNGDDGHEGFGGEREHHEGGEREHHEGGEHEGRNGTAPTIPKTGTIATKN